jgi:hypothetical protein
MLIPSTSSGISNEAESPPCKLVQRTHKRERLPLVLPFSVATNRAKSKFGQPFIYSSFELINVEAVGLRKAKAWNVTWLRRSKARSSGVGHRAAQLFRVVDDSVVHDSSFVFDATSQPPTERSRLRKGTTAAESALSSTAPSDPYAISPARLEINDSP